MKHLILPLIFLQTLVSCGDNRNLDEMLIDTSQFEVNNSLLKDGGSLEILGVSGNLREDDKIDFYNLLVARSIRTGDTVNVLLTRYFMPALNKPEVVYISNSSVAGKYAERLKDKDFGQEKNVNNMKPKSFKKVLYDREYIQVDVLKFPAVTGTVDYYSYSESK